MKRLVFASLLISLMLLLNTYYYLNHERYEAYLDNEDVINGFEGTVSISGTVINKSQGGSYIRIEYGTEFKIVKLISEEDIENGDRADVLGLLQGNELIAEKLIVYPRLSYYGVFIRSIIALALIIYLFLMYWSFDFRGMKFKRRKDNA